MTAKRIVAAKRDHHLLDLSFLLVQALNGLASASSLFIIAAGLTIVFGVTRIVNFAHGSFYMLGAYFGVTLIPRLLDVSSSFPMFLAGVLAAALGVGLIGVAMELVLLRRIYKVPELFQLLATFGVVLAVQDLVLKIWGPLDILLIDLPPGTDRLATIAGLVPALAGTVVVTIPSDVSHLVVRKSITVARRSPAPVLGLVENMAGMFQGPDGETLAREAGVEFLGRVPFDPALATAADRGEPYVAVAPAAPAARALTAIAARLRDTLLAARA